MSFHRFRKRKERIEDSLNNAWTEVTSPFKFEEHIENEFDFNGDKYVNYAKGTDITYHTNQGKRQKLTDPNMGNVRRDTQPLPPSDVGGPTTTKHYGKSKYHHGLGRPFKRGCKRYREEPPATAGSDFYDKTLLSEPLIEIPYTGVSSALNDTHRTDSSAYVKGVKLQMCWKITPGQTTLIDPITIRWAVLVPETNTGSRSDIDTTDFWKSRDSRAGGVESFLGTGDYTGYLNKRINTDKYGIMKTGHLTIGPSTAGSDTYRHWDQTKLMNLWIPVHKMMDWDNETSGTSETTTLPTSNVHFVWWYCIRGDLDSPKQFDISNESPLSWQMYKTVYHKAMQNS